MNESSHLTIREMPDDDRPREKMLAYGPKVLSDAELIAILIRTGIGGGKSEAMTAIDIGRKILQAYDGDLASLYDVSVEELYRNPALMGVGPAKACQLKAALELGHRVRRGRREFPQVHSPQDVAEYLMDSMDAYKEEHFVILLLNTKNRIFKKEEVSVGTLNASLVHPREVFTRAIRQCASAVILAHNHPSGDPTPSSEDRNITRRLADAGNIIGIDVLDHIIVGNPDFISFKQEGYL